MKEFDVLVIGGGPGGYTAAIRASQLGLSVALAEAADLGGTCLNWGCIPTKSLLHAADLLRNTRDGEQFGVTADKVSFDLQTMVKRSRDAAGQLSQGVQHLMRKNKIAVITGKAAFVEPGLLRINDDEYLADNVIIATGASAKRLGNLEPDGKQIWSAANAMTPSKLPKRLLVVGAGAIGVEFASLYQTLGSQVTLIEALDQILPAEDREIAELARASFEKAGIQIITSAELGDVTTGKTVNATINGDPSNFDAVILSIGVEGNTRSLKLENAGVNLERGFIPTNEHQQTAVAGIYAIGDVAGVPCLAHKASHEGTIAAETIAGLAPHALKIERIPGCTYCHPQIASIGLTEQQAAADHQVKVGRYPLYANGKAVATGASEGMIKTLFDAETGQLLGAHMVGEGVSEMIQGFAIAMELETTEQQLISTIFPHPTISEAMHESVLQAYDRTLNL